MTSARYPLPTDIVALVSFDGRVYPNEANPWDRIGLSERPPHPLETALEQWFSFATGKQTWVSVRGATIRGLVSARRRAKRSAWEVEVLIDADEDKSVALSLLSRMTAGVTKQGAERVFLRLRADSPLAVVAREAGFFPYAHETLYRAEHGPPVQPPDLPLRPRTKADALGLFQLYGRSVPANVRAIEGATLREWQAALEPWGRHPLDLVLEEQGVIAGWLRAVPGQIARFAVLSHGGRREPEGLVSAALHHLAGSRACLTLVPSHQAGLARALRRSGFSPQGEYIDLGKRLLKPTEELAAEKVSTAVTVS